MPQPTLSDVHVDRPLTNVSIAFMQSADHFIADRAFPNIPVTKRSDKYFTYPRGDWFRDEMKKRAPGTASAGSGWNLSTDDYSADVWALHKDIDEQIRSNQDAGIDLDRDATNWLSQKALINRDVQWASTFFTTGVWTGSTTGSDITPGILWDAGGSTPIADIREQIFSMLEKTGFMPNKLVLGAEVWSVLQDHPDFIARISFGTAGAPSIVTPALLAQVLELDEVLIARSVRNTASEGDADAFEFVFGKNALLLYSNPRPSLLTPSAGYTFSWTGFLGAGNQGQRIKRFAMPWLGSDRVEIDLAYDQKVVATDLGVFFSAVIS